ncbi:MAG: Proline-rich protein, partial [Myxococcaceae bacterium]|nr:Proline-rich protein [Myxococcaceae bacterium]
PEPDPAIVAAAAAAIAPPTFDDEENPTTAKRDIPSELLIHATGPERSIQELPTVEITRADLAPARDDVDSLLSSFEVSDERADKAVARDLKAMVGLDPTRTPPPVGAPLHDDAPTDDAGLDSLLAMTGSSPPVASAAKSAPGPARGRAPSYAEDRVLPTSKTKAKTRPLNKPAKTDRLLLVLLVILLAAGAGVLWMLKPGFFTGRTPEKLEQERVAREADKQRAALAAESNKTCKATLTVTDVPEKAEVLLRVGQAPADVEHMPVGARLEFVATAEGHIPKRTVVPAKAAWDPGPDGKPRFEVAVQLEPARTVKPNARGIPVEPPWPQGDPGIDVGGEGAPGTVHVVSTPRAAEIWLLAGMGPEAVIQQLPCKGDVDVLVAGPGPYRKRLHLKEAEFVTSETTPGQAIRQARVSAR